MSSDTGTAITPISAAWYRIVPVLLMSRNGGAAIRKNTRITAAPTSDPISGRLSSRAPRDRAETRSSAEAGEVMVDAMALPQRVPASAYFWTAAMFDLSMKAGPVRVASPPPMVSPLVLYSQIASTER